MSSIDTSRVPTEQFDQLEDAAAEISPEMLDLVHALTVSVRAGAQISAFALTDIYTPSEAAERLGMSRTHIYKLLDRGVIGHDRVGRDRRIPGVEIAKFETQRQQERRELAEKFAHRQCIENDALDELADLL